MNFSMMAHFFSKFIRKLGKAIHSIKKICFRNLDDALFDFCICTI